MKIFAWFKVKKYKRENAALRNQIRELEFNRLLLERILEKHVGFVRRLRIYLDKNSSVTTAHMREGIKKVLYLQFKDLICDERKGEMKTQPAKVRD